MFAISEFIPFLTFFFHVVNEWSSVPAIGENGGDEGLSGLVSIGLRSHGFPDGGHGNGRLQAAESFAVHHRDLTLGIEAGTP